MELNTIENVISFLVYSQMTFHKKDEEENSLGKNEGDFEWTAKVVNINPGHNST
ncbi:MAG: hypothetical protein K5930_04275 [Treponemataceae bacterium]|nr:hypothetical protein [Treponemataceae bacterium]